MRVLGIDPGYERLGVAIIERKNNKDSVLFSVCLQTSSKLKLDKRIFELGVSIEDIIKKWNPEFLAIEKLFFTTNQKTVMGVSETKGAITFLGNRAGLKICEYTPLQIKIATTGYGKATKEQVIYMVTKMVSLDPSKKIKHDDEYDAIAVALTCLVSEYPQLGR